MKTTIALLILGLALGLTGCDSQPTREELQSENDQLRSQLTDTHDALDQIHSDVEDLKTSIDNMPNDDVSEQADKADDISTAVDNAEEASE